MKKLSSFLIITFLAGAAAGCVVRTRGSVQVAPVAVVEVEEAPPPPRAVVIESRPGFVYVEGRWAYRGGRYVWLDGRWERERPGRRWVQGRWERRGRRHVWVEGRWEGGAGYQPAPRGGRRY
jgi:hypothetical protein